MHSSRLRGECRPAALNLPRCCKSDLNCGAEKRHSSPSLSAKCQVYHSHLLHAPRFVTNASDRRSCSKSILHVVQTLSCVLILDTTRFSLAEFSVVGAAIATVVEVLWDDLLGLDITWPFGSVPRLLGIWASLGSRQLVCDEDDARNLANLWVAESNVQRVSHATEHCDVRFYCEEAAADAAQATHCCWSGHSPPPRQILTLLPISSSIFLRASSNSPSSSTAATATPSTTISAISAGPCPFGAAPAPAVPPAPCPTCSRLTRRRRPAAAGWQPRSQSSSSAS